MANNLSEIKNLLGSLSLEDVGNLPVRRLKEILVSNGVDISRFLEKEELVERVKEEVIRYQDGNVDDDVQQRVQGEENRSTRANLTPQDEARTLARMSQLVSPGGGDNDMDIDKAYEYCQLTLQLGDRIPKTQIIWAKVELIQMYLGLYNVGKKMDNGTKRVNVINQLGMSTQEEKGAKYKDPSKAKELLDSVLAEDKHHGMALYLMYVYYSSPYLSSAEEADSRKAMKYLHRSAKAGWSLATETLGFNFAKCGNCDQRDMQKLQLCASCNAAFYCSKRCQKAAWKAGHKTTCKPGMAKGLWKRQETLQKEFKTKITQAIHLTEVGQYEESERLLEAAMEMDFTGFPSERISAAYHLGRHRVLWGQEERALPLLDEVLAGGEATEREMPLAREHNLEFMYQARLSRGVARWHVGREAEGAADLAAAGRLRPGDPVPERLLCELRLGLRPFSARGRARARALTARARALVAAIWENPPRHPGGAALGEAVRLCREALAAHEFVDTHGVMAQIHSLTADDETAAAHLERAVALGTKLRTLPWRNQADPAAAEELASRIEGWEYMLGLARLNLGRHEEGFRGLEAWASRGARTAGGSFATEEERRQEVQQMRNTLESMAQTSPGVRCRFGVYLKPPPTDGDELSTGEARQLPGSN